jgi:hypothetical protein
MIGGSLMAERCSSTTLTWWVSAEMIDHSAAAAHATLLRWLARSQPRRPQRRCLRLCLRNRADPCLTTARTTLLWWLGLGGDNHRGVDTNHRAAGVLLKRLGRFAASQYLLTAN